MGTASVISIIVSVIVAFAAVVSFSTWKKISSGDKGIIKSYKPDKSTVPIVIFIEESLASLHPGIVPLFEQAVRFINESVGLELFLKPGEFRAKSGEVITVLGWEPSSCEGNSCHEKAFAFTRIDRSGKPEAVYINLEQINNLDDLEVSYGIAHELGHVLGLDHDDFTTSFMYRKVLPKDPEMTSKDKKLLRELYGADNGESVS